MQIYLVKITALYMRSKQRKKDESNIYYYNDFYAYLFYIRQIMSGIKIIKEKYGS